MPFSLKAILGLETTKFERGLDKARNKLSSSVGGMMRSLAPIAGFLGFSTMAASALNLSREITNLSKVANAGFEDFQKRAFAAKTVGVEMEKLADIFKDVGDKIGDFLQTGGGPLVDFFENIAPKVGVTAEMFRHLGGPEALQLYYDSIDRANISQNEMTFFMEAIASDAALLIPLLQDGGKAFEDFGKQAEAAGLIMTKFESDRLEKVNLKMDVWKKKSTILTGTFLTKLIPALKILSNGLGFVSDIVGIGAANFVAFGTALIDTLKIAVTPAIDKIKSLAFALKGLAQVAKGDLPGAKKSFESAKEFGDKAKEGFNNAADGIKEVGKELKNSLDSGTKVLGEAIDKRAGQITNAFKEITGEAKSAEDAIADVIIASKKAASGADGDGGGGSGKGREIELEQKLRKMKLEALKAETRGQESLAEKMRERIKLAEKILKIMKETGATQREAVIIANSQTDGGGTTSTSTGSAGTKRISQQASRFGKAPTFEERERASGLFLAGNDPLSGRRGPEDMSAMRKGGTDKTETMTESIVKSQDKTTAEIKKLRTDPVN